MSDVRTAIPLTTTSSDVRRWIRRRRVAANGRLDPASVYSVLLALAMAVALLGQPLSAAIWPALPVTHVRGVVDVTAVVGLTLAALFTVLRQVGPLIVGRADATWLLPAPVSRRALLAPAFVLATLGSLGVGGLAGLAVVGNLARRPIPAAGLVAAVAVGAASALTVCLTAVYCQRHPRSARTVELFVAACAGGLLLVAVGVRVATLTTLPVAVSWPQRGWATGAAVGAVLLAIALWAAARAWRRLDRWPTSQIADASTTTAAYADSVYMVDPSYLVDLRERRYWQRHPAFRSAALIRADGLPPIVAQDLLMVRRRASRLRWLAGTALAPALVAEQAADWVVIVVFLLGALGAAGLTGSAVQADALNPALRRLMGLSPRQVVRQRLVVPGFVAAAWCAVALTALLATGVVTGAWWCGLGLAVGPAVAVAAVQRSRAGASDISAILIDTPLGAFPAGLLLWLVNGLDLLAVLTLPVSVSFVMVRSAQALGWVPVLAQAALSALAVAVLVLRPQRRY